MDGLGTVKARRHNEHTGNQKNILVGKARQHRFGLHQAAEGDKHNRAKGNDSQGRTQLVRKDKAQNHKQENAQANYHLRCHDICSSLFFILWIRCY